MKIIISGAGGRMGKALREASKEFPDIEITGFLEKEGHPLVGEKIDGVVVESSLEKIIHKGDVIIEFTFPSPTLEHLKTCVEFGKPMVIGTTGFNESEKEEIMKAGKNIPILFSSNMSVGMNLLFKLMREIPLILGENYEVEIVETHHRFKKDAPSGTALTLAEIIASSRGQKLEDIAVFGRKGKIEERKKEEIGIHAVRGGGIVGEHRIMFLVEGEKLEFVHEAYSRLAFARGALRGALWLKDKPNGVYSMEDVLFR